MQGISQIFKPEKISTKLGVNLYDRAKIQIFPTEWSTRGEGMDFSPAV